VRPVGVPPIAPADAGQGGRTAPAPAPESAPPAPQAPTFSVEFPGGTVKAYVEAVKRAANDKVNVVLPKDAEDVPIPALSMRDVTAQTALESLRYAVGDDSEHQFAASRISLPDALSETFVIAHHVRKTSPPQQMMGFPQQPPQQQSTRVFSIRDLVEPPAGAETDPKAAVTTETVLSALRALSELDAKTKTNPPELMLHDESKILIARGTTDQLQSIDAVLSELRGSLIGKRNQAEEQSKRARQVKLQQVELEAQERQVTLQVKAAADEVEAASQRVDRAKKLADEGQMSVTELDNLRAALVTARNMLDQAQVARQTVAQRAAIMNARAQAGGGPSESLVTAAYDLTDLKPFAGMIKKLAEMVVADGGGSVVYMGQQDSPDKITVRARKQDHEILVQAVNTVRRAKANEPNLPGLSAEELIRKSESK